MKIAIPARYASSRFPGKPLALIKGLPMVQHVWQQAVLAAGAPNDVIVATDDKRINDAVLAFGGNSVMTSADHENGTERLAELIDILALDDDEIIVNVQGDEPIINPDLIKLVGKALEGAPDAALATAADAIKSFDALKDPSIVKVVCDRHGFAHYFSRAAIPFDRDGTDRDGTGEAETYPYLRHIGIYAYRAGTLRKLRAAEPAPTEQHEKLEQLRALWHGMRIFVAQYDGPPSVGVDHPEDIAAVEAIMSGRNA